MSTLVVPQSSVRPYCEIEDDGQFDCGGTVVLTDDGKAVRRVGGIALGEPNEEPKDVENPRAS